MRWTTCSPLSPSAPRNGNEIRATAPLVGYSAVSRLELTGNRVLLGMGHQIRVDRVVRLLKAGVGWREPDVYMIDRECPAPVLDWHAPPGPAGREVCLGNLVLYRDQCSPVDEIERP